MRLTRHLSCGFFEAEGVGFGVGWVDIFFAHFVCAVCDVVLPGGGCGDMRGLGLVGVCVSSN